MEISVIIPTFNEADSIIHTLAAISRLEKVTEIIVVDGGSQDETVNIATAEGASIVIAERGRGLQLLTGAKAAAGDVLWFLHADSRPDEGSAEGIIASLSDPEIVGGNFTIAFDGTSSAARFLTWLYPKLRSMGLIYGDSGIFCRREAYDEVGGFNAMPLFEDLDLVHKLQRMAKLTTLPNIITTSSRRFEGRSFLVTFARWSLFQGLYWIGISPRWLANHYKPIRSKGSNNRRFG